MLHSVIQSCAEAGTSLVMADNLYMYGASAQQLPLVESAANDATTRKGRVRAEMAETLMSAHRHGQLRVAIARGADFFGPGVKASALGEMVFKPLLSGKTVRVCGDIDQPHCYTYIEDFGAALATLGTTSTGWGAVWHVPNNPARSTRDVIERAAQLAGVTRPKIAASGRLGLAIAGLFIPGARETIELLPHFQQPYLVDDRRWRAHFQVIETPFDDALQRTVWGYREQMMSEDAQALPTRRKTA